VHRPARTARKQEQSRDQRQVDVADLYFGEARRAEARAELRRIELALVGRVMPASAACRLASAIASGEMSSPVTESE
jgi:hypothetical protein